MLALHTVSRAGLTPFECRLLQLRASGLTPKEIARELHRSAQTISNSLTVAKEKLGVASLMEALILLSVSDGTRGTQIN
jgi:DNA-binding NarL/FixJ family response regulator